MQCKDIPDAPVLAFLANLNGVWAFWTGNDERDIRWAMPVEAPQKLRHAKMKMLIKRGLVGGCDCGCRGDFVITEKGRAALRCS